MDNYTIEEVKIILCLWGDVYSCYIQSIDDVLSVWCSTRKVPSTAPHRQQCSVTCDARCKGRRLRQLRNRWEQERY
jgi:hypothetical protein